MAFESMLDRFAKPSIISTNGQPQIEKTAQIQKEIRT